MKKFSDMHGVDVFIGRLDRNRNTLHCDENAAIHNVRNSFGEKTTEIAVGKRERE